MKENNLKYSITKTVKAENTDRNGFATNAFILKCLEDAATAHSESVGYGFDDMRQRSLTWMLVDWKVKVIKRPKVNDEMLINTWSRGTVARAFALRDFELYCNDELVAIASSRWILFDIKEHKIARTTDEDICLYLHDKDLCVFQGGGFDKLKQIDSEDFALPYIIKDKDIDGNGHVHNLVYLDIALRAIDHINLDSFSISYKKEILKNDNIVCLVKKEGDEYLFDIKNADTGVTNALIKMS